MIDGTLSAFDAERRRALIERSAKVIAHRHMGERLIAALGEAQVRRPDGVMRAAVHDRHFDDRLRMGRDFVPGPDALQKPPRAGGDGVSAIAPFTLAELRISHQDFDGRAESFLQAAGERHAGNPAAGDDNVEDWIRSLRQDASDRR